MEFKVRGLGVGVWGLGCGVLVSGFRVQGSGFRVQVLEFGVWGLEGQPELDPSCGWWGFGVGGRGVGVNFLNLGFGV